MFTVVNTSIAHTPIHESRSSLHLSELLDRCRDEMARYRQSQGRIRQSESCLEIVRRAAAGDGAALSDLLLLSGDIASEKCPRALYPRRQDVQQEVVLRILRKFRNEQSPYRPSTFAAYLRYLSLTIRSVVYNMQTREPQLESLDRLWEETGFEPRQDPRQEWDRRLLVQSLLDSLTNPLEQEVLYRRYRLGQSPPEIVAELRPAVPDITVQQVYRLAERAIRRLQNHPAVQAGRSSGGKQAGKRVYKGEGER